MDTPTTMAACASIPVQMLEKAPMNPIVPRFREDRRR